MRRYSREYLIRHPEKRGKDLETTRRSCEKFRHMPTTVVNYVEGTRYRANKSKSGSYKHLLQPKSGGIAYTSGYGGAVQQYHRCDTGVSG
ncbi:1-acyl-sn-glycerol-3-phosphate acyltransferase [Vibrio ishigakensis]|uniref:1-acyl-sn-glycerol-3-phosphate acyltransferase n=1 Tax=Vibrio ishigakensis TaxID=1481914 RepID=A0A0B8NV25_9VIBR|nr:1-acyl-sn-glycerol-3-phosphate acyltransferase [Vibrio ishigakensis]